MTSNVKCDVTFSGCNLSVLDDEYTANQFLKDTAGTRSMQLKHGPFIVGDLGHIVRKYRDEWSTILPDVRPFYAVKCNNDPTVVATMARLGSGFDCASKKEIKQIVSVIGAHQAADRIIFANLYKKPSHIRFAAEVGVDLMTFDSESELRKIKDLHPTARLLIRIKPIDTRESNHGEQAQKIGADLRSAERLLNIANQIDVNVIGVSFHVGLRCFDTCIYRDTIRAAGEVFDMAVKYGFQLYLLDIGGGFLGENDPRLTLREVADVLRDTVSRHFSQHRGLRIIAEPGQFFAMSVFTAAANVIGASDPSAVTDVTMGDVQFTSRTYILSDGIFGTLGSFDGMRQLKPRPLIADDRGQMTNVTLRGPTCYGLDIAVNICQLPQLFVGDWIVFDEVGAYTVVLASGFNGMSAAKRLYVINEKYANVLMGEFKENE